MINKKRSPIVTLVTIFSLMVSLFSGILITDNARASSNQASSRGKGSGRRVKVDKMSLDLERRSRRVKANSDYVRVVLQFDGRPSSGVNAILRRNGIRVREIFKNFEARVVELPASVLQELAAFDEVSYVSVD